VQRRRRNIDSCKRLKGKCYGMREEEEGEIEAIQ
jgi:hypothetical protein